MRFHSHRLCTGLREKSAQFIAREDGAILFEAAIVLPILLMIFVGMVEFSQAFTAKRRVASVAITTADLVAQAASVTTSNLNDIVSISNALLAPLSVKTLTVTVTSVGLDANNNAATLWICTWSKIGAAPSCTVSAQGCTATGAAYSLPKGLTLQPGNSLIVTNATYKYNPQIAKFLMGGVTFNSASYFKPRQVSCVTKL